MPARWRPTSIPTVARQSTRDNRHHLRRRNAACYLCRENIVQSDKALPLSAGGEDGIDKSGVESGRKHDAAAAEALVLVIGKQDHTHHREQNTAGSRIAKIGRGCSGPRIARSSAISAGKPDHLEQAVGPPCIRGHLWMLFIVRRRQCRSVVELDGSDRHVAR
jgi:hypothetical protein